MFETYAIYCTAMRKAGAEPLSEEIYRRSYAPKEAYKEPMVLTPKKANKVKPTLAKHNEIVSPKDFDKPEHYFDYIEAQQIQKQLRGIINV